MRRLICWLPVAVMLAALSLPLFQVDADEKLPYVPAPADNPLKGLVPYADPEQGRFPHSLEFSYLSFGKLMKGPQTFDWSPMEELLDDIASRRHQAVVRIWLEYPGHKDGIPQFLRDEGLKVTSWKYENDGPFPDDIVITPDYSNPKLQKAIRQFLQAFGKKYDGDPRLAFLTAGILGIWGEWHNYPRDELMAKKPVQTMVMKAYAKAFQKTPVLLRYPAGEEDWSYAPNHRQPFGYHDDSFAWATLDTGREADDWFFLPALKAAGKEALQKWKTEPIGGEIRPELWGRIFDDVPKHKKAQDFAECVQQTHVTWLMDTGMFEKKQSAKRIKNAVRAVQSMGYEFHILTASQQRTDRKVNVELKLQNQGVAPFYYDWEVKLVATRSGKPLKSFSTPWSVQGILPGAKPTVWKHAISIREFPQEADGLAVQVVNPLKNGMPLRFANEYPRRSEGTFWPIP